MNITLLLAKSSVVVMAAVLASGCALNIEGNFWARTNGQTIPESTVYNTPQDFSAVNVQIQGSLGSVENFQILPTAAQGYTSPSYSSIDFQQQIDSSNAVYADIRIYEDLRALQPGINYRIVSSLDSGSANTVEGSVMGCSGHELSYWIFDETTYDGMINVTLGAQGQRIINFTASFSGNDYVQGKFEMSN